LKDYKIKKSKEVRSVKKAEFHELKTNERTTREKDEGKEDKFMMIMSKNKTKILLEKFHLTPIIERSVTYANKKLVGLISMIKKTIRDFK
jgi:hypothetical protein